MRWPCVCYLVPRAVDTKIPLAQECKAMLLIDCNGCPRFNRLCKTRSPAFVPLSDLCTVKVSHRDSSSKFSCSCGSSSGGGSCGSNKISC